jgi:quercetin dioxygenase-like cupin family protein
VVNYNLYFIKMNIDKVEKVNIFLEETDKMSFFEQVEHFEKVLKESGSPDIYIGNSDAFPLTHSFSDGIYTREIFIKKGMIAIGKIHKHENTFFLLKGKLQVFTEKGVIEMEAPIYGVSPSGTKRVVYALEDSVFLNVHPNPENIYDIEELEKRMIVSDFAEYKEYKQLK